MKHQPKQINMQSEEYKAYCRALQQLIPVNTEEKAKEYRKIWEEFHEQSIYKIV